MEAAPCGIQCGVAVATGELQKWQSSKSVIVGIGQDFDVGVIRAPPHGLLGSRAPLSADVVQVLSDAVSEHCGVWFASSAEQPIEAVLFDMRPDDKGRSLAALRGRAVKVSIVEVFCVETATRRVLDRERVRTTVSRARVLDGVASVGKVVRDAARGGMRPVGVEKSRPTQWWNCSRAVRSRQSAETSANLASGNVSLTLSQIRSCCVRLCR